MKKALSILCAILIASSMIVSAFAAAVESPAVEPPKVVDVVVTDAEGNEIDLGLEEGEDVTVYVQLTSISLVTAEEEGKVAENTVSEAIKESLQEANEALVAMEDLGEVHEDFAGKEIVDVMNVQFSEDISEAVSEGATIAVKTTLKLKPKTDAAQTEKGNNASDKGKENGTGTAKGNNNASDKGKENGVGTSKGSTAYEPIRLPLIRFINGKWVVSEKEYAEVLEDGTVVVYVNQPGTFTIVVDPEHEIIDERDLVEETEEA